VTARSGSATPVPVSVVVCARNREAAIERCLISVLAARPAEVIVVDGNSTDGTASIARRYADHVVLDRGGGLGAARQLGAEVATQEAVVYVDSDTILSPTTLDDLLADVRANGFDAAQARLLPPPDRLSYWQAGERWRRSVQEPAGAADAVGCQATIVKRSLVLAVRFDPVFDGAAEDGDFFFRARRQGARVGRSAAAVAFHEDRRTMRAFVAQRVWHGRGLARMLVRHRGRYSTGVSEQAGSLAPSIFGNVRYVPFIGASIAALALGMALEALRLLLRPDLRRRLVADRGVSSGGSGT
jgi:glycosyltransferase involved in cell wall biosynthesis